MTSNAPRVLTDTSPPQQYGYQSPQPPYNNNYGQPTPPPQQYGYNQVRIWHADRETMAGVEADLHRDHHHHSSMATTAHRLRNNLPVRA